MTAIGASVVEIASHVECNEKEVREAALQVLVACQSNLGSPDAVPSLLNQVTYPLVLNRPPSS